MDVLLKWNKLTLPEWRVKEAGLKGGNLMMMEVNRKEVS